MIFILLRESVVFKLNTSQVSPSNTRWRCADRRGSLCDSWQQPRVGILGCGVLWFPGKVPCPCWVCNSWPGLACLARVRGAPDCLPQGLPLTQCCPSLPVASHCWVAVTLGDLQAHSLVARPVGTEAGLWSWASQAPLPYPEPWCWRQRRVSSE